jgi:hypothetical protein
VQAKEHMVTSLAMSDIPKELDIIWRDQSGPWLNAKEKRKTLSWMNT